MEIRQNTWDGRRGWSGRTRLSRGSCAGIPGPGVCVAFTLIELMIVVGIAALVMATAVPFVHSSLRKDPLRQAISDVVEACSTARARAILTGTSTDLRINPAQRTLEVVPSLASGGSPAPGTEFSLSEAPPPAPTAKGFSATLSSEITIEMVDVNYQEYKDQEEARVRFFPNSTSDEFTIVFHHEQRAWRKVTLEVVTALAEVQVMEGRTWR